MLFGLFVCSLYNMKAAEPWTSVELPYKYQYPADMKRNTYSSQFPTHKAEWFKEAECDELRSTSLRWVSKHLENIKGFSFKGLVHNNTSGSGANEYAIFFHKERCYKGGPEYGWVFRENSPQAYFYLCDDCNQKNQRWFQWPGDNAGVTGDVEQAKGILKNSSFYQYWNIKVTPEGNFIIELINPFTWERVSCTLKRPPWFPDLYRADGYITINVQKRDDKIANPPSYIHVDEVKILK